jgi:hypothetical protein
MERLVALRPVRWGGVASLPGLWLAVAWADFRFVALAFVSAVVAAIAVHERDRRNPPDDDLVL